MTTELDFTLAETEKRIARAKTLRRWGMLSGFAWALGPYFGGIVGVACLGAAMIATTALVTIGGMLEANAKLAAARAHAPHQLPPARVLNR